MLVNVQRALTAGADVNWSEHYKGYPQFALAMAAAQGDLKVVEALLDHKANVNSLNGKAEAGKPHPKLTPLMFAVIPDFNEKAADYEYPATSVVTKPDMPAIARLLFQRGADLNAQDAWGRTALMMACRTGHEELGNLLATAITQYQQSKEAKQQIGQVKTEEKKEERKADAAAQA
jgi:ankyrin repeat protein